MKTQLNIRVSQELKEKIKEYAKEHGLSLNDVVEKAINIYLNSPKPNTVNNPKTILDMLLSASLANQISHLQDREKGIIYITDLTFCPIRWKLLQQIPSAAIELPNSRLLRGSLAHLGLQLIVLLSGIAEIEKEVSVNINGHVIKGRADIVTQDAIYELKFPAKLKDDFPHPQHVLQVWFYKLILKKPKAYVLYITDEDILQLEISPDDVANAIRRLGSDFPLSPVSDKINSQEFIKAYIDWWMNKDGPIWGWECRYCRVASFCPIYKYNKEQEKKKKNGKNNNN